jgi:hypothetical protein
LELLREQGHLRVSKSQKNLSRTPVAVAPEEGLAAWVIERERLSAPSDETEAKTIGVVEARLLKLLDPQTKRGLPNAEAIVEGRSCLFIRISAEGWGASSERRVARPISVSSSREMALSVFEKIFFHRASFLAWSKELPTIQPESEVQKPLLTTGPITGKISNICGRILFRQFRKFMRSERGPNLCLPLKEGLYS